MIRKILIGTGVATAALAAAFFLLYQYTPIGKNVAKAIRTGLIFHTEAYSATFFPSEERKLNLDRIQLPAGFRIDVYADNIENARSLAMSSQGTLFVGTRTNDKVFALKDTDNDKKADEVYVVADGLNMPNGVAVKDGALYVAEMSRILRFDDIDERLKNPPEPEVVYDDYPEKGHHGWKFIAFGPDGKLYVPVGAPCNLCERDDPFASITRINPDGTGYEVIARGVRNTVGFDWHPETGKLWFTDNGRDWMGDDRPPDELNKLEKTGQHFGFPYCHGNDISDPQYDRNCDEFQKPEIELGPHVASLGMRFYTGDMFPGKYKNNIFIAEHGSWNRTVPIGYRITMVTMEKGEAVKYEVFAQGWRHEGNTWGRPVDLLVLDDGSMLVSDDHAGAVYRIVYEQ